MTNLDTTHPAGLFNAAVAATAHLDRCVMATLHRVAREGSAPASQLERNALSTLIERGLVADGRDEYGHRAALITMLGREAARITVAR